MSVWKTRILRCRFLKSRNRFAEFTLPRQRHAQPVPCERKIVALRYGGAISGNRFRSFTLSFKCSSEETECLRVMFLLGNGGAKFSNRFVRLTECMQSATQFKMGFRKDPVAVLNGFTKSDNCCLKIAFFGQHPPKLKLCFRIIA